MLELKDRDRVRILAAVASRGAPYQLARVAVITVSQLLLLAVPLLGIVRTDLWAGHHVLLGEPTSLFSALRGFVLAVAVLWGLTFASNIVVGRFFCGWGCPVGYASRLGEDVELKKRRPLRRLGSHVLGAAFVAVFVGAIMLWWVDPRVMLEGSATARAVTGGIFVLLWVGGFGHAFVWRFGFCKSACPIGLYYRVVTSRSPIGIVFSNEPSPCIECGACVKICPVDIEPRALGRPMSAGAVTGDDGVPGAELATPAGDAGAPEIYGDAECLRCGDCIEACRMIFAIRPGQTPPLRFGRVAPSSAPDRVGQVTARAGPTRLGSSAQQPPA